MQSKIQLRISPADAANASVLLAAIAQNIGRSSSQINGYHILKQSIDARSRQQVWINLTLQVFIDEPVMDRHIEPYLFPILPKNAKEVHIIGAGPEGLFAALECIQLGLRPIVIERGEHDYDIEMYDVNTMKKRAEVFKKQLDVKYILGAQFFFIKFAKRYSGYSPRSSTLKIGMWDQIKMIWLMWRMIFKMGSVKSLGGFLSLTKSLTTTLQNTNTSTKKTS